MSNYSHHQFCWNELGTSNLEQSKDFYGKTFGWKFNDIEAGHLKYTIVTQNDRDVAGIWSIPSEQQGIISQHWLSYILVEDVTRALEHAEKNGAEILRHTTKVGDLGHLGIIKDPGGARVGLWQPMKK